MSVTSIIVLFSFLFSCFLVLPVLKSFFFLVLSMVGQSAHTAGVREAFLFRLDTYPLLGRGQSRRIISFASQETSKEDWTWYSSSSSSLFVFLNHR